MFNFITQLLVLLMTVSVTVTVQLCGNQDPQQTVDRAFSDSEIFKDLEIKPPNDGLNLIGVTYSNVMSSASVSCGTELKSFQTDNEPLVEFTAKSDTIYTFMMLDLDAPSPSAPTLRSFIHWMVVNAYGGLLNSGFTIHPYFPPMPTLLSGPHRYVFMVFEQPEIFNVTIGLNETILERNNFNVGEWVKQNTALGPVAGNYFLEQLP